MSILVTGGAGFIGSAVVRRLLRQPGGDTVVNVDRLTYAGNLDSLRDVQGDARHVFEQVDVCDAEGLRRVFALHRPSAVIHLAAESHVDRSLDGPAAFVQTNVVGTFTLLQEARRHWAALPAGEAARFRFLHISTDEVFGSADGDVRFTEDSPYRPSSPYAATKAAADHLVRAWQRSYALPCLVVSCSNNYGPHQFPEKLIPLVILNALEGRPLPLYGHGEHVRDWLFVDDHADAILAVLARGTVGETYAVGGDAERRNIDVVHAICDLVDEMRPDVSLGSRRALVTHVADRPGHDARYAVDAARMRRELGWSPTESFASGLRRTVRWYLDNEWWWSRVRTGAYRGERLGLAADVERPEALRPAR